VAWRTRQGKRYLYKTVRIAGKARGVYFGCGQVAETAYAKMLQAREDRSKIREARQRAKSDLQEANDLAQQTAEDFELLLRVQLLVAGFYQHARGRWQARRKGRGK
jgi:hypothetical protein